MFRRTAIRPTQSLFVNIINQKRASRIAQNSARRIFSRITVNLGFLLLTDNQPVVFSLKIGAK